MPTETMVTQVSEAVTDTIPTLPAVVDLQPVVERLDFLCDGGRLITGFLMFFVVVTLCYFCYKLFKIFF